MKRDPRLYLQDILESIVAIEEYVKGTTKEEFSRDTLKQDGVIRRLEVIGEAANRLPQEIKDQYTDISWRKISGMRNRLTHEYFGIILERVWEVIERDLPELKGKILGILRSLDES